MQPLPRRWRIAGDRQCDAVFGIERSMFLVWLVIAMFADDATRTADRHGAICSRRGMSWRFPHIESCADSGAFDKEGACYPFRGRFKLCFRGVKIMKSSFGRRDFNKLAVVALGGLVAGTRVAEAADKKDTTKPLLLQEPHVCRGLNPNCKGEAKGKKHDCAGQTNCSAAATEHTCKGGNDCAGLGGCGETPGENTCKGKGDCAVPITTTPPGTKPAKTSRRP